MSNWVIVTSVCAFFMIFNVSAGPTQISGTEKTFRNDVNYQSLHTTLRSIEDRLRNLESSLSTQCELAINGKIDYYGQKIENIERNLSRFQFHMRIELDKISENISSKNYMDDITKDRTIRKIDMIYERINHKLENIEGQIDLTNIKSQNAREMVMTKLEKMEESLTIRDADMEAELADAVAAIDDLKTTCSLMEENILNGTKETTKALIKSSEKSVKKQYIQTINLVENSNKTLYVGLANIQKTVNLLLNQTNNSSNIIKQAKDDLDENLNEYANKITDMYSDLWQKSDILETTMQNLAKVTNLSRSEQQNGLRALMVQVGRKSAKQGVQSDSSIDNQKLTELSQKIDSNFENIMLAQNLFLESCHRVQMDESQLESQISIVLDRLIDIFENKTSVEPKDIKQLENLIRTHDSNIRRSIYHITNNLLALMQTTTDGNDEIIEYVSNQKFQLDSLYTLLQDVINSSNDSEQIQNILESLQDFQQQLMETQFQTQTSLSEINSTNTFMVKMLNASENINSSTNIKLQQTMEFIKNIYHILTSIEIKINKSYLDYFFNKYNINFITHRFGKKLNDYIQSTDGANISEVHTENNMADKTQIPKLILEIFGDNQNTKVDPYDDFPYTIESSSKSSNGTNNEIDNIVLLCEDKNCDQIDNSNYTIITQNETGALKNNCLPNYINQIDVRSNSQINSSSNCSFINETFNEILSNSINVSKHLEKTENTNKCSPNYTDLIDVRSNNEANTTSDCINTTLDNSTNPTNYNDKNESYDIDVRYNQSANLNVSNTSISVQPIKNDQNNLTDKTSTILEFMTDKWVTTKASTIEETETVTTYGLKLNVASKILEQEVIVTETWTEGLSTISNRDEDIITISEIIDPTTPATDGEDNYTNSLENDSTEISNEFEYTNHEYH